MRRGGSWLRSSRASGDLHGDRSEFGGCGRGVLGAVRSPIWRRWSNSYWCFVGLLLHNVTASSAEDGARPRMARSTRSIGPPSMSYQMVLEMLVLVLFLYASLSDDGSCFFFFMLLGFA
ncbi:hypothetical protein C4D60_Mb04t33770 [Musa balbisiana]|uniref:Uncharacterized protein n=1 Tax=Musa balbisiana TaxID=52838 RepID=A0A4S8KGJ5_MUSBA|nr:hypothetical protein C4D60_Mb04t33770 [Musa balbisiana]